MTRRIVAVLISIVLAVLGTTAVLLYVRAADDRALAGKQATAVLVADRQIPAGTTGRALRAEGYLRQVRMPAETVPQDALAQLGGDLDALVVTAPVQRGQLLLRAMFGTATSVGGTAAIPSGRLAIAARVKAGAFGPGSVQPGAKVAIFYTYTPMSGDRRDTISGAGLEKGRTVNSVTRLLLTDIEVLGVDANGAGGDGDNRSRVDPTGDGEEITVTFAMTQVDAERLAHAVAIGGELNIGLLGDASNVKPDAGVDNRSLFG
jgi:pilus assembly protein CpaB